MSEPYRNNSHIYEHLLKRLLDGWRGRKKDLMSCPKITGGAYEWWEEWFDNEMKWVEKELQQEGKR